MSGTFELFRLSLLAREQRDLYDEFASSTREEWLRKVFLEDQPFEKHGVKFHYASSPENSDSEAIIGKIGRHVFREENKPPEEGLEEYTHETWRAALLMLDPRHHNDGQKLALQRLSDVGEPRTLVSRLVNAINERYPHGPYLIEEAQLIESESFWDYVKRNKGKVTSITFDLIPPNMFDSSDAIDEELRAYRDREKAAKVSVTIQNLDGIDPSTDRVKNAVNYVGRGGGGVKARAVGARSYNSNNSVKRTKIEAIIEKGVELFSAAKDLKDEILGRTRE